MIEKIEKMINTCKRLNNPVLKNQKETYMKHIKELKDDILSMFPDLKYYWVKYDSEDFID